jgi:hypothetical protein
MSKTVLINFIILTNLIFSQCNNYNESQCNNDNHCEWIEDVEYGSCGSLSVSECYNYPGECYVDSEPGWYDSSSPYCTGGTYQIDNSYCQEVEMPDCSEFTTESSCNHTSHLDIDCSWIINSQIDCTIFDAAGCDSNNCNWIENISSFNCAQFGSSSSCSNYSDYGCSWEWSWGGWGNHGSSCVGGAFQIDNSYCEGESGQCEESFDILGDMNYDGVINVQDAINMIGLILNQQYNVLADMNYDNTVNVADVIIIINIILNDS